MQREQCFWVLIVGKECSAVVEKVKERYRKGREEEGGEVESRFGFLVTDSDRIGQRAT